MVAEGDLQDYHGTSTLQGATKMGLNAILLSRPNDDSIIADYGVLISPTVTNGIALTCCLDSI